MCCCFASLFVAVVAVVVPVAAVRMLEFVWHLLMVISKTILNAIQPQADGLCIYFFCD
jgi:hypothetical protein